MNSMGDKTGRIHMTKQNLDKMDVRRVSALRGDKRTGRNRKGEDAPITELDDEPRSSGGKRGRRDASGFDDHKKSKNSKRRKNDF